jgi:hypothetical protein
LSNTPIAKASRNKNTTWDYSIFGTQRQRPEPDGKFDLTFKMLADEGKAFNR